ncbi:MAG TPA: FAD synthetase family protein [Candidatus Limnocylindrales bacterium]|nr:FAD synthetase family protein [Candidatus Limnocylindrales bacterium]
MIVVAGVDGLAPEHGRLFVTLGVFDGLHRGHLYLLEALGDAARSHGATPAVITFDHHPDEILSGSAPPLLLDPDERLERLAVAGVGLTVVHHFDRATRETPYDAFVRRIAARVDLAGFLMTPESSFGYERGGTPDAVARLGRELGYDVVVVPTLEIDGRPVRSTDIRSAIAAGDLSAATLLLGRRYAVVGEPDRREDARLGARLTFPMPVALPPPGRRYPVELQAGPAAELAPPPDPSLAEPQADGSLTLATAAPAGDSRVRVVFR